MKCTENCLQYISHTISMSKGYREAFKNGSIISRTLDDLYHFEREVVSLRQYHHFPPLGRHGSLQFVLLDGLVLPTNGFE